MKRPFCLNRSAMGGFFIYRAKAQKCDSGLENQNLTDETTVAPTENALSGTTPANVEQATTPTTTEMPGAQNETGATEQTDHSDDAGSPSTEPAAGTAQTETEGEQEAKRNNVPARERIQQLAQRARAAEAERDRLLGQLEKLQTSAAPLDPLEYATDAEYTQALVRQSVEAARADFIRQQAEAAHHQHLSAVQENWTEKVAAFRQQAPDFEQVAYHAPISNVAAEAIAMAEAGPQIAYYLGKNPAKAREISAMPPLAAAIEIGRLNERLSVPLAKKTTTAPPPPATVQGLGAPASKNPETMSMEEYEAWRRGNPS